MHHDEESSFTELSDLMKKIKAVESIARHHEDAAVFHTRAGKSALQQGEKARSEARALRELYKVPGQSDKSHANNDAIFEKGSISKFAVAFSGAHTREKHARVDSITESSFSDDALRSVPTSKARLAESTATAAGHNEIMKSNDINDDVRTVRISQQTNAAYTSLDRQNASSEYTTISSSFVQRVAKRKESISALQNMNPSTHQRIPSDPRSTRTVYAQPVHMEEAVEQVGLESELEHIKAFL